MLVLLISSLSGETRNIVGMAKRAEPVKRVSSDLINLIAKDTYIDFYLPYHALSSDF